MENRRSGYRDRQDDGESRYGRDQGPESKVRSLDSVPTARSEYRVAKNSLFQRTGGPGPAGSHASAATYLHRFRRPRRHSS